MPRNLIYRICLSGISPCVVSCTLNKIFPPSLLLILVGFDPNCPTQIKGNNNDPSLEVEFMETCVDCDFVLQLWHNVVGLYDYTLLLEYCPYSTLQNLLDVRRDNRYHLII